MISADYLHPQIYIGDSVFDSELLLFLIYVYNPIHACFVELLFRKNCIKENCGSHRATR